MSLQCDCALRWMLSHPEGPHLGNALCQKKQFYPVLNDNENGRLATTRLAGFPDNVTARINASFRSPHGSQDNTGHSLYEHPSDMEAVRAQEEYGKAVSAFSAGDPAAAAFYLGAMAHYIGDVSQFGHAVPFEPSNQHSAYEGWAGRRTKGFNSAEFDSYMVYNWPTIRTPYTAVKRISKAAAGGRGDILHANLMLWHWDNGRGQEFVDSVGLSLNLGANELADVLHRFYVQVVSPLG